MLTDYQCALYLQQQYDGVRGVFDHDFTNDYDDRFCIKLFPDCSLVAHEGSHDVPNWFHNFQSAMLDVPDFGGVERGFYLGVAEQTTEALPLLPKDKPVYVAGHSRGAARAWIMAAMLIKQGYQVIIVAFGSPRPGDEVFAAMFKGVAARSYRNYFDFDQQDFVCDVPLWCPVTLRRFVHPIPYKMINVPPVKDDPWMLLARHHLFLYSAGVKLPCDS